MPPRWQVVRKLGEGGQADVWLARDTGLGQLVAIKVFRPDLSATARERLRREVLLGRTLQHPGLVRVFELVDAGDRLAAVMEWVPEGSVQQRLAAGRIAWTQVAAFAEQVLETLGYLHGLRIVHRDVKPSNLLIDEAGRVRLADLGLARPLAEGADLTATATTVGTPGFMSPEQIRGDPPTPSSDLYSLGVTLFHLLAGRPLFEGQSAYHIADRHLHEDAPDVRTLSIDCPAWLASFVARLLEKDPRDRFADAAAALAALHRGQRVTSPRRRRRLMAGLAVAAGAVVVTAVLGLGVSSVLRTPETVRVDAVAQAVRGFDRRGQEVWRRDLPGTVTQVERADIDGDGQEETVVADVHATMDRSKDRAAGEILVVRNDGEFVTRFVPNDAVQGWPWEFSKELDARFKILDLNRDGQPEIVAICQHFGFYPTVLAVFDARQRTWNLLLLHSGRVMHVAVVPGPGPTRLRFSGVNNPVGFSPVVGEIAIGEGPPERHLPGGRNPLGPIEGGPVSESAHQWVAYTLLPEGAWPMALEATPDGGSVLTMAGGRTLSLDRFGNPEPATSGGQDMRRARLGLFSFLAALAPAQQPLDPDGVRAVAARARRGLEALWGEAPVRAAVATAVARALARTGRVAEGIEVLAAVDEPARCEELRFRQAHLCAVGGRLTEAEGLLRGMVNAPRSQRGAYDGVHLLLRVAAELRNGRLFEVARQRLKVIDSQDAAGLALAVDARRALWWDEFETRHTLARSWTYMPEGDALGCLARWRLGRTAPGDREAMQASERRNPEATWECRVAGAAAALGMGRSQDALTDLDQAEPVLRALAADDFAFLQLHELARALRLKALAAAGEAGRVRTQAGLERRRLRSGLLPAILVAEAEREAAPR